MKYMSLQLLSCLVLLVVTTSANADSVAVEIGNGTAICVLHTNSYSYSAIKLTHDITRPTFIDFKVGQLNKGLFGSIAYGVQTTTTIKAYVSIGASILQDKYIELYGSKQFIINIGLVVPISDKLSFDISAQHFSNGSELFGWNQKYMNAGVEHIVVGIKENF